MGGMRHSQYRIFTVKLCYLSTLETSLLPTTQGILIFYLYTLQLQARGQAYMITYCKRTVLLMWLSLLYD